MLVASCIAGCASATESGKGFGATYGWVAPRYLLTALCQGLTLLFLSSSACNSGVIEEVLPAQSIGWDIAANCSMSTGAKLSISSMSFWFASAVTGFLAHKAEKAEMNEEGV